MTPEEHRSLDAEIAEKVMKVVWDEKRCRICGGQLDPRGFFCTPKSCSLRPAPSCRADGAAPCSTDISAAMDVEQRFAGTSESLIKNFQLRSIYFAHLSRVVANELPPNQVLDMFSLVHASAEQRCQAALAAIKEKE